MCVWCHLLADKLVPNFAQGDNFFVTKLTRKNVSNDVSGCNLLFMKWVPLTFAHMSSEEKARPPPPPTHPQYSNSPHFGLWLGALPHPPSSQTILSLFRTSIALLSVLFKQTLTCLSGVLRTFLLPLAYSSLPFLRADSLHTAFP